MPRSAMARTTIGLSVSPGEVPADAARKAPPLSTSAKASAIWLRPVLCT